MSLRDCTEEEAKALFAEQLVALAAEGPATNCADRIAEIFAENEAECARMDEESAVAEREDEERRSAARG